MVQNNKVASTGKRETMMLPVEPSSGLGGTVQNDLEWQALNGNDDPNTPLEDNSSFQ